MATQLLIGTLMIALSTVIMTASIAAATVGLTHARSWLLTGSWFLKLTLSLTLVTLWLLASISATVWVWAVLFVYLDLFAGFEPALYFSLVSLTTLGFGDVVLTEPWRLLSGFVAANGLVLFGLNTAFLIEAVVQLNNAKEAFTRTP